MCFFLCSSKIQDGHHRWTVENMLQDNHKSASGFVFLYLSKYVIYMDCITVLHPFPPILILITVPDNFHDVLMKYTQHGYRVIAIAFRQLPAKLKYAKLQRIQRYYFYNVFSSYIRCLWFSFLLGSFMAGFKFGLGWWCLTPLSTIFQLYRGGVLLVEETGVTRENHWHAASHLQTIT